MSGTRYRIEDLCARTGFTRRTIRYYIEAGLLDPPAGRGRGGFYDEGHLRRLVEIRDLQERGLKLRTIQRQLLAGEPAGQAPAGRPPAIPGVPEGAPRQAGDGREVWARYPVSPGVELLVRGDVEAQAGARLEEAVRLARTLLAGGNDGKQL